MLSIKDIPYLVTKCEAGYCQVFDNKNQLLMTFENDDQEQLIKDIKELFTHYTKGRYRLEMKNSKKNVKGDPIISHITLTEHVQPTETIKVNGPTIDVEAEVQKRLNEERQRQQLQDDIQAINDEKKDLETIAGKINFLGNLLVKKYLGNMTMPMTVNGTEEINETNQTTTMNQLDDNEKYKEAVQILCTKVDADTLLKVAHKVQNDPSVINLIKNFL